MYLNLGRDHSNRGTISDKTNTVLGNLALMFHISRLMSHSRSNVFSFPRCNIKTSGQGQHDSLYINSGISPLHLTPLQAHQKISNFDLSSPKFSEYQRSACPGPVHKEMSNNPHNPFLIY
ncbi:hypothetical protein GDO78_011043 [Eleutherodactylus coqui]|uniref:Uncharacterized protein n=1 Tax=Eleutherodactylus coqui TaxID=57060 RepID=A0A8J6F7R8_ELECQ|nr:hypothetical protein GDO78_011043 [Eleutherodactylus coqui]